MFGWHQFDWLFLTTPEKRNINIRWIVTLTIRTLAVSINMFLLLRLRKSLLSVWWILLLPNPIPWKETYGIKFDTVEIIYSPWRIGLTANGGLSDIVYRSHLIPMKNKLATRIFVRVSIWMSTKKASHQPPISKKSIVSRDPTFQNCLPQFVLSLILPKFAQFFWYFTVYNIFRISYEGENRAYNSGIHLFS